MKISSAFLRKPDSEKDPGAELPPPSAPVSPRHPASGHARRSDREMSYNDGDKSDGNDDSEKFRKSGGANKSDDDGKKREKKDEGGGGDDDDHPNSKLPLIIVAVVVALAIIGGIIYWLMTRGSESTDDAYTEGRAIAIAARVPGYVTTLNINDNVVVKAGDLMLIIDPRDYITARDQAAANLALAQAQLSSSQVDLEIARVRAPANFSQAEAELAQAEANQRQAEQEYRRQRSVDQRATTQTNVDQATAQMKSATAAVENAKAQLDVASLVPQNIQSAEDTVKQRQSQVAQAKAKLEQAEVNLSYTELRAPQDGRITRRNVDRGTYLQAGQEIFYVVTADVWVTANFKESQLADMRPGQTATVTVDAFPDLELHGHVDSIQQGSGARFSAFPAENATGNFVKIVRRVPVKIIIDSGLGDRQGLPLGISVIPTVTVR
ncbi:MAG: HlyD family secretion protein [Rhodospirillales bacterium]|nr:HlyD family secretion protein [Rhodospirillales bacterium]